MRLARMLLVWFGAAAAPAVMAQKWEAGGGVGGGFYTSQDITAPSGSIAAKIQTNIAGSAWLGNNGQGHWGGELRYDYQRGDLQLNSTGASAAFGAETHAVHYDVLWHAAPNGSRMRPFLAIGAGVKTYRGTGPEVAFQPLSYFALLTKAQDITPLISVGGGVKFQISPHVQLRFELHDYITTFPKKVITPNQNAKAGAWMQDLVPMVGLSFTFPGREF